MPKLLSVENIRFEIKHVGRYGASEKHGYSEAFYCGLLAFKPPKPGFCIKLTENYKPFAKNPKRRFNMDNLVYWTEVHRDKGPFDSK